LAPSIEAKMPARVDVHCFLSGGWARCRATTTDFVQSLNSAEFQTIQAEWSPRRQDTIAP